MKILLATSLALTILAGPASAVEQCRFIQARADRDACYKRQDDELAVKRKTEADRQARFSDTSAMDSMQQTQKDDDAMLRSIRGICRGC